MRAISISQLARQMYRRKEQGEKPYLLFLGTGISISSGVSRMNEVIDRFLIDAGIANNDDLNKMDRDQRFEKFLFAMQNLSEIDQYNWLQDGFKNTIPSLGYLALTSLIEDGYFDIILTTNWDNLLDASLEASTKIKNRKNYRIYVRGVDQEDFIVNQIQSHTFPKIKIVKLHGELNSRVIFATPEETTSFPDEIANFLKNFFRYRDLIMIGYSVSDQDIKNCMDPKNNTLIYVNPKPPSEQSFVSVISKFEYEHQIVGPDAEFDVFMSKLHSALSNLPGAIKKDHDRPSELPWDLLEKINMNLQQVLDNTAWLVDYLKNRQ